jgi:DNA polymerase III epsilon subunit-like protein
MKSIVFDTETTGLLLPSSAELKDQPQIIELALIIAPEMTEHCWLLNPGKSLPEEIVKITGVKDEQLIGKPSFIEILPELVELFRGAHQLIAHNLPFDLGMLINELRRCGKEHAFPYPADQLCTVSAYAHLKGHNLKLTDLYQKVLGRELKQEHRALADVRALVEILQHEGII